MPELSYYNLRKTSSGHRMVKFDDLLNVEAIYNIAFVHGHHNCECFAANRASCRHRDMIPAFYAHKAVDNGKFYCYETGEWLPAIKM